MVGVYSLKSFAASGWQLWALTHLMLLSLSYLCHQIILLIIILWIRWIEILSVLSWLQALIKWTHLLGKIEVLISPLLHLSRNSIWFLLHVVEGERIIFNEWSCLLLLIIIITCLTLIIVSRFIRSLPFEHVWVSIVWIIITNGGVRHWSIALVCAIVTRILYHLPLF